jgi:CBS domain-containing protein
MNVRDIMNPSVDLASARDRVFEIIRVGHRYHFTAVVIVDDAKRPVGIVTHHDVLGGILPTQQELAENEEYLHSPQRMEERLLDVLNRSLGALMTSPVVTIGPDDRALAAGALMKARGIKQLPVVEDGKVVGIVTYADIVWGLADHYLELRPRQPAR